MSGCSYPLPHRKRVCVSTGLNNFGQLGITSSESHTLEPMEVFGLPKKVAEISVGYYHSCAVTGGNVFTRDWGGANESFFEDGHSSGGQLGHGNDIDYSEPILVNLGKNIMALHISCGFNHTGAIFEYSET